MSNNRTAVQLFILFYRHTTAQTRRDLPSTLNFFLHFTIKFSQKQKHNNYNDITIFNYY